LKQKAGNLVPGFLVASSNELQSRIATMSHGQIGMRLGLRGQAERDTAFERTPALADSDRSHLPESAVAASLCRRSPRRPLQQTVQTENYFPAGFSDFRPAARFISRNR
jgi:hypothetical protein